jgi:hypothetical protein
MSVDHIQAPGLMEQTGPRAAARPAASAIFLHAGWRSCGTWLWETLRDQPGVRAFYEPLHEGLADLDSAAIGAFRPDSWGSGHTAGAPYFHEYAAMLAPRGRGVAAYQRRFAFDDFFATPAGPDPALIAYVDGLIRSAAREGRLPVLKFCRSLGRVGWLQQHFPGAFHAVILRGPVPQWRSARLQMERDANHYFVLAPFVILARNAGHPLLAQAMARLGVVAPVRLGNGLGVARTVCWRHVQKLDWAERYRGFLALWVTSTLMALSSGAMVIDSDRLGHDAAHRDEAAQALGQAGGWDLALPFSPDITADASWPGTEAEAEDAARAAFAALDFLRDHASMLSEPVYAMLSAKLAPNLRLPGGRRLAPASPTVLPTAAPPRSSPAALRMADAATYVAFARATYPLRRAHYHLDRWRKRPTP